MWLVLLSSLLGRLLLLLLRLQERSRLLLLLKQLLLQLHLQFALLFSNPLTHRMHSCRRLWPPRRSTPTIAVPHSSRALSSSSSRCRNSSNSCCCCSWRAAGESGRSDEPAVCDGGESWRHEKRGHADWIDRSRGRSKWRVLIHGFLFARELPSLLAHHSRIKPRLRRAPLKVLVRNGRQLLPSKPAAAFSATAGAAKDAQQEHLLVCFEILRDPLKELGLRRRKVFGVPREDFGDGDAAFGDVDLDGVVEELVRGKVELFLHVIRVEDSDRRVGRGACGNYKVDSTLALLQHVLAFRVRRTQLLHKLEAWRAFVPTQNPVLNVVQ
mmetsp:Transcript_11215/g.24105  ORF Transcript_11215/g.24105 Transcript_11215/m.24105 type:complete len:326 (+) Transcript_11215:905-1882(+)